MTRSSLPARLPRSAALRALAALLFASAGALGACGAEEPPAAGAAAGAAPSPAVRAPEYDHVVLVTFDTLRADHLPSYGYVRETAPFFARLAERGVLFENALASVSHTSPSHATMLTGLPPRVHGVRRNGNKLAPTIPSLPALLAQRGFARAAFLGAQFLTGITPGFEHVSKRAPTSPELVDQAIEWVRARGDQPYFLWLHLYDPHRWKHPKLPPAARAAVPGGPQSGSFYDEIARLHGFPALGGGEPFELPWSGADGYGQAHTARSREDVLRFVDDYDKLIRFADSQAERLYAALEPPGTARKGLWILTCDHGEGLGSHGYEGHGGRIYNEQLRVGLLFHATDGSLAPRRVSELVGHMDLLPTLSELFGLAWRAPDDELFGRSLLPLLAGARGFPERVFFAEQRRAEDAEAGDAGELVAVQDRRHKLIRDPDGSEQFYALADDPLELHDLGPSAPRHAELRAALARYLQFYSGLAAAELEEPAPEFLEELQDLGYAR
jgi:arylsulfatase A-like enzyme